jgi:hypothetical protein
MIHDTLIQPVLENLDILANEQLESLRAEIEAELVSREMN